MNKAPSISTFFPCYNDAMTIGRLVSEINKILPRITSDYEIIVVNDGSTDNSLAVLKDTKKIVPKLRIINHPKNRGYGGALKSGFGAAKKELVFYTDGDGQYDVNELPLLLSCLTPDVDIVNGIKSERQDEGIRVLAGNAYKSIVRNLFNLPVYDVDCDFRLIRNGFMKKINLKINSGAVCVELINKLQKEGAHFREVTVHHFPRQHGPSQFFRPLSVLLMLRDIVGFWATLALNNF